MKQKVLVPINSSNDLKVGTVFEEPYNETTRMILKIEDTPYATKHYYVSRGVKTSTFDPKPEVIMALKELKIFQYIYSICDFTKYYTRKVTFK